MTSELPRTGLCIPRSRGGTILASRLQKSSTKRPPDGNAMPGTMLDLQLSLLRGESLWPFDLTRLAGRNMLRLQAQTKSAVSDRLKADGYLRAVQGSGTHVFDEGHSTLTQLVEANAVNLADLADLCGTFEVCAIERAVLSAGELAPELYADPARDQTLLDQHTAIVDALEARDPDRAELAMETHCRMFRDIYDAMFPLARAGVQVLH